MAINGTTNVDSIKWISRECVGDIYKDIAEVVPESASTSVVFQSRMNNIVSIRVVADALQRRNVAMVPNSNDSTEGTEAGTVYVDDVGASADGKTFRFEILGV